MKIRKFAAPARGLLIVGALFCIAHPVGSLAQPTPQLPDILKQMPPLDAQNRAYQRNQAGKFALSSKSKDQQTKSLLFSYSLANAEASRPLYYLGYQLYRALSKPELTDQEIAVALTELRSNLAAESHRRADAMATLQNQPAMQTLAIQKFLLLTGESGDEKAVVNAIPKGLTRVQSGFQAPAGDISQALTSLNVTDEKTRAAIVAYAKDYEEQVEPLLDQVDELNTVAKYPASYAERAGVTPNDAGVRELMNRYSDEVEGFKARRAEKLRALDAEIDYSQNPRLDAALLLLGLTNDFIGLLDPPDTEANYNRDLDLVMGGKAKHRDSFAVLALKEEAANLRKTVDELKTAKTQ